MTTYDIPRESTLERVRLMSRTPGVVWASQGIRLIATAEDHDSLHRVESRLRTASRIIGLQFDMVIEYRTLTLTYTLHA